MFHSSDIIFVIIKRIYSPFKIRSIEGGRLLCMGVVSLRLSSFHTVANISIRQTMGETSVSRRRKLITAINVSYFERTIRSIT